MSHITSRYRMRGFRVTYRRGDCDRARRVIRSLDIWGTASPREHLTADELAAAEPLERERCRDAGGIYDSRRWHYASILAAIGATASRDGSADMRTDDGTNNDSLDADWRDQ